MADLGTAAISLVGGFVGAGAAVVGGYLGAKQQAKGALQAASQQAGAALAVATQQRAAALDLEQERNRSSKLLQDEVWAREDRQRRRVLYAEYLAGARQVVDTSFREFSSAGEELIALRERHEAYRLNLNKRQADLLLTERDEVARAAERLMATVEGVEKILVIGAFALVNLDSPRESFNEASKSFIATVNGLEAESAVS